MGCKLSKVYNPIKITRKSNTKIANRNGQVASKKSKAVKNSRDLSSRESNHSNKAEDVIQQCNKTDQSIPSQAETTGHTDDTHEDESVEQREIVSDLGSNVDDEVDDGIYDDFDNEEEDDDEEFIRNKAHFIKVRPMAAKGERVIKENLPMVLRIKEVNKDVENLISPQSSTINTRDRKFRPKAAKGVKTPSWSSLERCRTPVSMIIPTYSRHGYNERGLVTYQANCLNEWMLRQNKKADNQE